MQKQGLAPGHICANGPIYTLDAHNSIAPAIAVKGGHFFTFGCALEIEANGRSVISDPSESHVRTIEAGP